MAAEAYDPRYLEGIRHFNAREFFEAHEVWEDVWRDEQGPARQYYQGLIQVAVCLHHFGNRNAHGARRLYHSSRGYLEAYRPHYLGVQVDCLLENLTRCCAKLLSDPEDFPCVALEPDQIPRIRFDFLRAEPS